MPRIQEKQSELEGVLAVARAMAVAARTAPKTRGEDAIETLIVCGGDLNALSDAMKAYGEKKINKDTFVRDAGNVLNSHAVFLIGLRDLRPKRPEKPLNCGGCGYGTCAAFLSAEKKEGEDFPGPVCMFQSIDLGIAMASACAVAARFHVDNRIMYSIGGPARTLGWMASQIIIGIPISCAGKNIYFDRNR